jgi:hypothetical protein
MADSGATSRADGIGVDETQLYISSTTKAARRKEQNDASSRRASGLMLQPVGLPGFATIKPATGPPRRSSSSN